MKRITHIILVAVGLGIPAAVALSSSLAAWPKAGIVAAAVAAILTSLGVAFGKAGKEEASVITRIAHKFMAVAGVLSPALALFSASLPAGSKALLWVGAAAGIIASLKTAFQKIDETTVATLVLLGAGLLGSTAQAQITPNSVAPDISFCFGKTATCVMPDLNISVVNYDLVEQKWTSGVTTIGLGYQLLFFADQSWASGIAVHGAGQFAQQGASYFAVTPTLVLAKYFEAGATFSFRDGSIGKSITLGLGVPWDLATGRTMSARMAAARAQQ